MLVSGFTRSPDGGFSHEGNVTRNRIGLVGPRPTRVPVSVYTVRGQWSGRILRRTCARRLPYPLLFGDRENDRGKGQARNGPGPYPALLRSWTGSKNTRIASTGSGEAFWTCDKKTGNVSGPSIPVPEMTSTYQLSDVCKTFHAILSHDGMGAHALRREGVFTLVPTGAGRFLDRLEAYATALDCGFCAMKFPIHRRSARKFPSAIARNLPTNWTNIPAPLPATRRRQRRVSSAIVREGIAVTRSLIVRSGTFSCGADYALCEAALADLDTALRAADALIAGSRPTNRVLSVVS